MTGIVAAVNEANRTVEDIAAVTVGAKRCTWTQLVWQVTRTLDRRAFTASDPKIIFRDRSWLEIDPASGLWAYRKCPLYDSLPAWAPTIPDGELATDRN